MLLLSQTTSHNHYIRSRNSSQGASFALSEKVRNDPTHFFSQLTAIQQRVLNQFFYLDSRYVDLWVSQEAIARYVGISREHVNRILYHFESLGIISSAYRHLRTSRYRLSNFFYDPKVRSSLVGIFAAFSFMPWNLTIFRNGEWHKRDQIEKITQYKSKSSFINYLSIPDQSSYIPEPVIHARAHEVVTLCHGSTNKFKNQDKVVMSDQKTEIRESIRALKQLNLTIHGQIRLSVFPDRALEYGVKKIQYSVAAKDKFGLLFSICRDYCKDNLIPLDWKAFDKLKEEYGYPDGCAMLNPSAYSEASSAKRPSSAKTQEPPQRKEWVGHTSSTDHPKDCTEHMQCRRNKEQKKFGWSHMSPYQRQKYMKSLNPTLLNQLIAMAPDDKMAEITEAYAAQPDQEIDTF